MVCAGFPTQLPSALKSTSPAWHCVSVKNEIFPLQVPATAHVAAPHPSHVAVAALPTSVFLSKPCGHATSPSCATHMLPLLHASPGQLGGALQTWTGVPLTFP